MCSLGVFGVSDALSFREAPLPETRLPRRTALGNSVDRVNCPLSIGSLAMILGLRMALAHGLGLGFIC